MILFTSCKIGFKKQVWSHGLIHYFSGEVAQPEVFGDAV